MGRETREEWDERLGCLNPNGEAEQTGVTYDAGALIACERRKPKMWDLHDGIVARRIRPVVPAGVLAQVWRGGYGRQSPLTNHLRLIRPG